MRSLTGKMICPLVFAALADVVSRREALVFVDHHHEASAEPGELGGLTDGRRRDV